MSLRESPRSSWRRWWRSGRGRPEGCSRWRNRQGRGVRNTSRCRCLQEPKRHERKEKSKKNSSWYLLPHLETQTDLSCPEFPVCCQPVRRVHEDFRDAQSFLDGLQLQSQQVALYAESFECLEMGEITEKDVRGSLGKNTGQLLVWVCTRSVRAEWAFTACLNSSSFASLCNRKQKNDQ